MMTALDWRDMQTEALTRAVESQARLNVERAIAQAVMRARQIIVRRRDRKTAYRERSHVVLWR